MKHLYDMQKLASFRKQAFAEKLASFMQANRGIDYVKTPEEAREDVREMLKQATFSRPTATPAAAEPAKPDTLGWDPAKSKTTAQKSPEFPQNTLPKTNMRTLPNMAQGNPAVSKKAFLMGQILKCAKADK